MTAARGIAARQQPLHLLNRIAFGPRPGDLAEVERTGWREYLQQQLDPEALAEPPELTAELASFSSLKMTPIELFAQVRGPVAMMQKGDQSAEMALHRRAHAITLEAMQARVLRAIYNPRQLHEVMTAFWFNHFNVFAAKGLCNLWTGAYEQEAIRPHTMGRFADLLAATAKHPAMLFYLDNWQNTAPGAPGSHGKFEGINENYAREVMELHTLGVEGGYTQADVIALAHILTGWGLMGRDRMGEPETAIFWTGRAGSRGSQLGQYGFFFNARRHDFSDKKFLGQTIKGGGLSEGEAALAMLASSPATAHHVSFALAQFFVADEPPPTLVTRMARRYLETDGHLGRLLECLFESDEFWSAVAYAAKFKTPYEYILSAVRATGSPVHNANPLLGQMALMGQPLYGCQTPDGYKNTRAAWLNPDAMMMRLSFATTLGLGHLPLERNAADEPDARLGLDPTMPSPAGRATAAGFDQRPDPPGAVQLALAVGDLFSPRTANAVERAPANLRAPIILGSPEFMLR